MEIKLIALDLDGTTLDSKGRLSPYTERALNKAMEKGAHVVIATGRVRSALPQEILNVAGIEYAITSNGAAITDLRGESLIYQNCIAPEALDAVYGVLSRYDYMVEVFIKGEAFVEKAVYDNLEMLEMPFRSIEYIKQTRKPHENVLGLMMENRTHVENINVVFKEQQDRAEMKERLLRLKDVTITSSLRYNLEIGGADTSKAEALKALCRKLDIKGQHVMACGDSPNDEAMLLAAGLPVAMGNAEESVKAVAKYITGTNDEHGVAQAIERFVFAPQE